MKASDRGVSLPLVMGAILLFSALAITLSSVAHLTIKRNDIALKRGKVGMAVEAGANDFVSRLNAYAEFNGWSAARVKRELDKNSPTSPAFPKIVRESGFGQWVAVARGSREQFTYDIVDRDADGLVIRVTGRTAIDPARTRTVEYHVQRRTKGDTAVAVQRPYTNAVGYAYVRQLIDLGDSQGSMARHAGGGYLSVSDYESTCGEGSVSPIAERWRHCFRPGWTGFDQVHGDLVTGAPLTVHGSDGMLAKPTALKQWPKVSGVAEIVGERSIPVAASTKIGSGGNPSQTHPYDAATVRSELRSGRMHSGDYTALTSPPATFKEVRRNAVKSNTCRFMGATQVVMYADDIYVRSPHTPANYNKGWAKWCADVHDQFRARMRTVAAPDYGYTSAGGPAFFRPNTSAGWVQLSNVPKDAVFMINRLAGTDACNAAAIGDNNGIGNSSGVGYPANYDNSDPIFGTSLDPYSCRNGDLFIEGVVSRSRTFAAENNVYLTGGIRYSDRNEHTNAIPQNSDDVLGVVAQENVFIYNPPIKPCQGCADTYYRYPRGPYPLPVLEAELGAGVKGAPLNRPMPWTAAELQGYRNVPATLGPADPYVLRGKLPNKVGWLSMPQFDGVIVAETGAFVLENPLMHNRAATIGGGGRSPSLSAVVTGALYSRYAPLLHIEFETGTGEVKMHGLHGEYISDSRLARTMPPGFNGLSVTMYRLAGEAEIGSKHLSADHQFAP